VGRIAKFHCQKTPLCVIHHLDDRWFLFVNGRWPNPSAQDKGGGVMRWNEEEEVARRCDVDGDTAAGHCPALAASTLPPLSVRPCGTRSATHKRDQTVAGPPQSPTRSFEGSGSRSPDPLVQRAGREMPLVYWFICFCEGVCVGRCRSS
jgi:hypothetical protein